MTKETDGWRCPKCNEYMVWHGLRKGVPVCPVKDETQAHSENVQENKP